MGIVAAGVGALVLVAVSLRAQRQPVRSAEKAAVAERPAAPPVPQFVGHGACVGCHAVEAEAWRGSQHARAMQPATPATVLGSFDGARFTYGGTTSTFFRKGDRYLVRTDGPDGKLADFEVTYTFGVDPLQQYLIGFPDGRMQALSIAWDARPPEQGGGRWFHLYPGERIDFRDPLHWTRPSQDWNYVCADCHSTNLRRHYDAERDRFATTWTDVSVTCEACHGAGSSHVAWAEKRPGWERLADAKGLAIGLDERRGVTWNPDPSTGNAVRSRPLESRREVEICAVCHARRTVIATETVPTGHLLDTHDPALLTAGLYYVDGQQEGEVYVWGSFLQSKMYARGVTCSDCHEPHGGKLPAPGNAACTLCHAPAKYEVETHLLHRPGSTGAQCAACHMPARTYMVIDPRRDHSFRIPRPDLSARYGVRNACNACHADRDAGWAAAVIERAFGPQRKGYQSFAEALDAGRTGRPGAEEKLAALARDRAAPAIARATALAALERFPGPDALAAIGLALRDPDPLVRAAALDGLGAIPPKERARLAEPLADDPVRTVRVKAGRALAAAPLDELTPEQRARRERAFAAYVAAQEAVAERPESHHNLGIFHAERGDAPRAEAEYRVAIHLQSDFVPAYANLADLDRALGREDGARAVLEEGLQAVPNDPSLLHALGLQRVRDQRVSEALPLLARAFETRPEDARFAYVYGVALHSAGKPVDAITVMRRALERSPYDPDLLFGLATFNRDAGHLPAARDDAQRLAAVAPRDPRARMLVEELGAD